MRMKMFSAETIDAAKALIFAEMGEDAVILSEREVDGGVEVRAATDKLGGGMVPAEPFAFSRMADSPRARMIDNPLRQRARDALIWHGAPNRFAERVAEAGAQTAASATAPEAVIAAGLETVIEFRPVAAAIENDVVLVGPPGHGRTAAAAKLTRRAAVANHVVMPIAADMDGTAGGAQLSAYLARETDQVRAVETPDELFSTLRALRSEGERCVIDLPSINPFDADDMASLRDLVSAIKAEPILVLSAEGHPEDQADAASAFARAGVKRAILSKLDIARRRGGAVAAISSAGLALSHLSASPFIGGGLVPAGSERLASLLLEDSPGRVALKGAA